MPVSSARTGAAALLLTLALAAGAAQGADLRVPGDHSSLEDALAAAEAGDRVLLAPGSYRGTFEVPPGVSLIGTGSGDSRPRLAPPALPADQGTEEPLNEFEDDPLGEFEDRPLNELLDEARLRSGGGHGVPHVLLVRGMEGRTAEIRGIAVDGEDRAENGIIIETGDGVTLAENLITGSGTGISARGGAPRIDRNELIGNKQGGILLRGGKALVTRNRISRSQGPAVYVLGKFAGPVVGGEKGMGNVFRENGPVTLQNTSRQPIVATYNDWGWMTTAQMSSDGYPSNVDAIEDGRDEAGLGDVDYRYWVESGGSNGPARTGFVAAAAAVAAVGLIVLARRRTARAAG
jgi:hypothetical protein